MLDPTHSLGLSLENNSRRRECSLFWFTHWIWTKNQVDLFTLEGMQVRTSFRSVLTVEGTDWVKVTCCYKLEEQAKNTQNGLPKIPMSGEDTSDKLLPFQKERWSVENCWALGSALLLRL